jgi:hypothetical protein
MLKLQQIQNPNMHDTQNAKNNARSGLETQKRLCSSRVHVEQNSEIGTIAEF